MYNFVIKLNKLNIKYDNIKWNKILEFHNKTENTTN